MLAKIEARNSLENDAASAKNHAETNISDETAKTSVVEKATEVLQWVSENEHASIEELTERRKEFQEFIQPFMASTNDEKPPQSSTDGPGPSIDEVD